MGRKDQRWRMIFSLLLAVIIRIFLVIISYGCKVPAGIFVPSMAIGATFGRMVGILVQALYEANPDSRFFAACSPDVPVQFYPPLLFPPFSPYSQTKKC